MAKTETKVVYKGVSGSTLLFLLFLTLKLTHVIDWSWWWVLAPMWIPLAIIAIVLFVALIGFLLTKY